MFTKEERLFIWKKVYEEIERSEDGGYMDGLAVLVQKRRR